MFILYSFYYLPLKLDYLYKIANLYLYIYQIYEYYEYQKKCCLYYLRTSHKFLELVYLLNKDKCYEIMNNKFYDCNQIGLLNEILGIKNDNYAHVAVEI